MAQVFIGRQPIFDQQRRVVGYELASWAFGGTTTNPIAALMATTREVGIEALAGGHSAFLPFSAELLPGQEANFFETGKIVIEFGADSDISVAQPDQLQQMRDNGYRVALPLVQGIAPDLSADILRFDSSTGEADDARTLLDSLEGFTGRLLATNVHSWSDFERYQALGFDYFQGTFLNHPAATKDRKLPASRLTTMRLLAKLNAPETELEELEKIISEDVSLSYRLLRHLNSAFFALSSKIESIRHAVALLGLNNLRVWSSIILLAKIDDKPAELMKTALIRGKMCEKLAAHTDTTDEGSAFMVGLLSTLEALLDQPMDEILKELPVADEIAQALKYGSGPLGQILQSVLHYERLDWPAVDASPLDNGHIQQSYLPALQWAEETVQELSAA